LLFGKINFWQIFGNFVGCWLLVGEREGSVIRERGSEERGERRENFHNSPLSLASLASLASCCLFPVACCCWVGILLMNKEQSTKNNQPRTINQEQSTKNNQPRTINQEQSTKNKEHMLMLKCKAAL
jgi:hypothetical protein